MLFINSNGRIVYGKAFDDTGKEFPVPMQLTGLCLNDSLIKHNDTESFVSGIIMLPDGPMIVASHPILTSEVKDRSGGLLSWDDSWTS